MTREQYFDRLYKAKKRLMRHFKFQDVKWNADELVVYSGKEYFPVKYIMGYNDELKCEHTCLIHDLKANSVVEVRLSDIAVKEE